MAKDRLVIAVLALGASAGCVDDLPEYNFIDGFRVLALAADAPSLEPGATTRIRALIAEGTQTTTVTYDWSWCPLSSGSAGGYECSITRDELQTQLDDAGVPLMVPPYELGTTSSVAFEYPLPSLVFQGICEQIAMGGDIPAFLVLPNCDDGFPVTFTSVISDDDETITAVKEINLLFEDAANVNTNPTVLSVRARRDGMGDPIEIPADGSAELIRGQTYELEIDVDESDAQTYERIAPDTMMSETRRETLTFTWFINAGSTGTTRTSYIPDELDFEKARKNDWEIPRLADYDGETATVVIVARDNRQGTSWLVRRVKLRG